MSSVLFAALETNTDISVYLYPDTRWRAVSGLYLYPLLCCQRIYPYLLVSVDTKVSAKVSALAQFWGLEKPQTYFKPPKPLLLSQIFQKNPNANTYLYSGYLSFSKFHVSGGICHKLSMYLCVSVKSKKYLFQALPQPPIIYEELKGRCTANALGLIGLRGQMAFGQPSWPFRKF